MNESDKAEARVTARLLLLIVLALVFAPCMKVTTYLVSIFVYPDPALQLHFLVLAVACVCVPVLGLWVGLSILFRIWV
jgi:Na+/phosphate symporter